MGYIHAININDNNSNETYLIEPLLFATAGGTSTALTASIINFTLVNGVYVHIKVGEVGANATLNVSNTGAKDIYYNNVKISSGMLTENNIYTFIYTGAHWDVLGDITSKNILIGTTIEWQSHYNQVYPRGTIVIYSDHGTITEIDSNQQEITKTVPGIKIADGSTPLIDAPFVGDDVAATIRSEINDHINDNVRHITAEERAFWNNKINCNDTVSQNNLILNRN